MSSSSFSTSSSIDSLVEVLVDEVVAEIIAESLLAESRKRAPRKRKTPKKNSVILPPGEEEEVTSRKRVVKKGETSSRSTNISKKAKKAPVSKSEPGTKRRRKSSTPNIDMHDEPETTEKASTEEAENSLEYCKDLANVTSEGKVSVEEKEDGTHHPEEGTLKENQEQQKGDFAVRMN